MADVDKGRLLKTKDAARELRCSTWKIREMARNGQLPVVGYDRDLRFDRQDIDKFIQSHRQVGLDT